MKLHTVKIGESTESFTEVRWRVDKIGGELTTLRFNGRAKTGFFGRV